VTSSSWLPFRIGISSRRTVAYHGPARHACETLRRGCRSCRSRRGQHAESGDALTLDQFPLLAARARAAPLFQGILVGEDRQTTAIILRLVAEKDAPVPRGKTLAEIVVWRPNSRFRRHLVGEPVQIQDTFPLCREDGAVLGWAAMSLLVLVIWLIFRQLRWVLLPLSGGSIHRVDEGVARGEWLRAQHGQLGHEFSVMVVGTATVIHVIVRFRELRLERKPRAAARETLHNLAHAIFWTTVTTAAGFATQLTSHVTPVQSFGLMMGIGTMVILGAAATILPGHARGSAGGDFTTVRWNSRIGGALIRLHDWVNTTRAESL